MKLFICVILFSVWVSCCCFPAASPELSQPNPDDDTNEVRVTDMPTALEYLKHYGYLSKNKRQGRELSSLISKKKVTRALRKFQKMVGLKPTGQLDADTQEMMSQRRCGVKDTARGGFGSNRSGRKTTRGGRGRSRPRRYVLKGGKWSKSVLKYAILNYTPDLTEKEVKTAFRRAFQLWSNHTNLQFIYTTKSHEADIKISFGEEKHGDNYPFDGKGGELAHAFYPSDGRAHFDDAELFTSEGKRRGVDLFTVAAHEFGHILGLGHSDVRASLMAPVYKGYIPNLKLDADDIRAIQRLYGKKISSPTQTDKDEPAASDLCTKRISFDAMHYENKEDVVYAFQGSKYYKIGEKGVLPGYPKNINELWNGLPSDVSASVYSQTTRRTYFFKDDKVWRYNENKILERGFPQRVSSLDLPENPDAAIQLRKDGKVYVFKGNRFYQFSEYQRYNGVNRFGSRRISREWNGLRSKVDAAFQWKNGKSYLIRGDSVWRFSDSSLDNNFPKSFSKTWLGCGQKELAHDRLVARTARTS